MDRVEVLLVMSEITDQEVLDMMANLTQRMILLERALYLAIGDLLEAKGEHRAGTDGTFQLYLDRAKPT